MKSSMLIAAVLVAACFAVPSVSSAQGCCRGRFPIARKAVAVVATARPVNWVRPRCSDVRFPVARRGVEVGANVMRGGVNVVRRGVNLLRPRCCR